MRPSPSTQVGLNQDNHIQGVWKIGLQHSALIDAGLDAFLHPSGLQTRFWHMLIISPHPIFRMRTAAFVFSTEVETQCRIVAQLGNELETALLRHQKSWVVAKMTIQRQVDGPQQRTNEQLERVVVLSWSTKTLLQKPTSVISFLVKVLLIAKEKLWLTD